MHHLELLPVNEPETDYVLKRLAQARRAAARAAESSARTAHLVMADHYAARLRIIGHSVPGDSDGETTNVSNGA